MDYLLDSGFLYASLNSAESRHTLAVSIIDALIVSIAERLNITRILTLDQRDFRLVRPRHCAAFEILP